MDWSKLRRQLIEYFSPGELRALCFDLDIPYHDLPGDTLTEKVIDLIEYCRRHQRIADLLAYCQKTRPDVSWPEPVGKTGVDKTPVPVGPLHDVAFEKGSTIEQVKNRLDKLHAQYDQDQAEIIPLNALFSELRSLFNRHTFSESFNECKDKNWYDRLCAVVQTTFILERYWGYVKDSATQAGDAQILTSYEEVQSLLRKYGQSMTDLFEPPPPAIGEIKRDFLAGKIEAQREQLRAKSITQTAKINKEMDVCEAIRQEIEQEIARWPRM